MSSQAAALLDEFNAAFNRHDARAMLALMTDDCVFENTYPPPDGTRYQGRDAVLAFWDAFFAESPAAEIVVEASFVAAEHGVQRWRYSWQDTQGQAGHVRGVDVFRFRDGLIAEKLSYVKG